MRLHCTQFPHTCFLFHLINFLLVYPNFSLASTLSIITSKITHLAAHLTPVITHCMTQSLQHSSAKVTFLYMCFPFWATRTLRFLICVCAPVPHSISCKYNIFNIWWLNGQMDGICESYLNYGLRQISHQSNISGLTCLNL